MDKNMYKTIIEWGIPETLDSNNSKIEFVFDESKIPTNNKYYKDLNLQHLHCEKDDVKFCLYDFTNKRVIFCMDFFKSDALFLSISNDQPHMKLQLLNIVDSNLRKRGIASYYIKKLQEYCVEKNLSYIKINPNPDAKDFIHQSKENALPLNELKKFYLSKSTEKMPIKIVTL